MSKALTIPAKMTRSHSISADLPFDRAVEAPLKALVEATRLDGAALALAVPAGLHEALQALGLGERTSVSLTLHVTMAAEMKALDIRGIIRATHREGNNVVPLHRVTQLVTADGTAAILACDDLDFLRRG